MMLLLLQTPTTYNALEDVVGWRLFVPKTLIVDGVAVALPASASDPVELRPEQFGGRGTLEEPFQVATKGDQCFWPWHLLASKAHSKID